MGYRRRITILAIAAIALLPAVPAGAQQTALNLGPNGAITFAPGLRIQPRYLFDAAQDNNEFFIARVRFKGGGNAFGIATYFTELKLDNVGRLDRTSTATIENAWINFTVKPRFAVRAGLYDAPFSRDALTSDSKLLLMDRSLIKDALTVFGLADNTVGVMAHGRPYGGRFEYAAGVFDNLSYESTTGTAPRQADELMVTARLGYHVFEPAPAGGYGDYQGSYIGQGRRLSLGVNAARLANALDTGTQYDLTAWGADAFFNSGAITAQAEYDRYEQDAGAAGAPVASGWYAQGGYLLVPRVEVVARYQELDPNDTVADDRLQWTSVGANVYIRGHNLKLQSDYTFKHEQVTQVNNDLFQVQLQLDF